MYHKHIQYKIINRYKFSDTNPRDCPVPMWQIVIIREAWTRITVEPYLGSTICIKKPVCKDKREDPHSYYTKLHVIYNASTQLSSKMWLFRMVYPSLLSIIFIYCWTCSRPCIHHIFANSGSYATNDQSFNRLYRLLHINMLNIWFNIVALIKKVKSPMKCFQ